MSAMMISYEVTTTGNLSLTGPVLCFQSVFLFIHNDYVG